jgi:hypothetical protein
MPSMGGGLGMRTVWISLRAMNYTDQAFRDAIRNMKHLTEADKEKIKTLLIDKDIAMKSIQVGTLYAAMTMMVAQRVGQLLSLTQVGASYMSEFKASWEELKVSFADTLFTVLKPLLDVFKMFMDAIKNNGALRTAVVIVALLGVGLLALYSAYMILNGVMKMNAIMHSINAIVTGVNTKSMWAHGISVHGVKIAYWQLGAAMGAAFAAFTVTYSLLQGMNPLITGVIAVVFALVAAFWALYVAESAASWGVAAVMGGIAAGAAVATASSIQSGMPSHAVGTRRVFQTGPAWLHKDEIVYNPSTNRPAGVENQVMGREARETTELTVNFTGDIHTKADVEELDEVVGRKIYRAVKGST